VAVGGITAGTFEYKSPEQEAVFGGVAGQPYDPCFQHSCDNFLNSNDQVLDELARAAAYSVFYFTIVYNFNLFH
jgi:hypothetical protein